MIFQVKVRKNCFAVIFLFYRLSAQLESSFLHIYFQTARPTIG